MLSGWNGSSFTPVTGVRLPVGTPNISKGCKKQPPSYGHKSGHERASEMPPLGFFKTFAFIKFDHLSRTVETFVKYYTCLYNIP